MNATRFGLIRPATLAMAVIMLSSSGAFAQPSTIRWQVAFDRGLPGGGGFGAITTVNENGPGPGDVTAPFMAMNPSGILTITGTLVGQDPLVTAPPLKHRWLIATDLTASVAPGTITPLGDPNHTIELIACYEFPNYAVGPSHLFGTHLDGSLTIVGGGAAPIDFARVENSTYDLVAPFTACPFSIDPGSPYLYQFAAALQNPPLPFDTGLAQFSGLFPTTTVAIAHYFRFTLRQDGDAVVLPTSAVAQALQSTGVPMLSQVGVIVLILLLLSAGTVILMRVRSA